jgi:hypothetical protein
VKPFLRPVKSLFENHGLKRADQGFPIRRPAHIGHIAARGLR